MNEARSVPLVPLRRFYVTGHAAERFRERLATLPSQHHMPDLNAFQDLLAACVAPVWDAGKWVDF